eukprot:IDg3028t1
MMRWPANAVEDLAASLIESYTNRLYSTSSPNTHGIWKDPTFRMEELKVHNRNKSGACDHTVSYKVPTRSSCARIQTGRQHAHIDAGVRYCWCEQGVCETVLRDRDMAAGQKYRPDMPTRCRCTRSRMLVRESTSFFRRSRISINCRDPVQSRPRSVCTVLQQVVRHNALHAAKGSAPGPRWGKPPDPLVPYSSAGECFITKR